MCEQNASRYHSNRPVNPHLLFINTRKSVITHLRVVQCAVCLVLVTEPKPARQWQAKCISRHYGCTERFVFADKRTATSLNFPRPAWRHPTQQQHQHELQYHVTKYIDRYTYSDTRLNSQTISNLDQQRIDVCEQELNVAETNIF
jgi:hypothetical protein